MVYLQTKWLLFKWFTYQFLRSPSVLELRFFWEGVVVCFMRLRAACDHDYFILQDPNIRYKSL